MALPSSQTVRQAQQMSAYMVHWSAYFPLAKREEMFNLPLRFRDEEPHSNHEEETDTGIEPASFEAPVPLVCVDHVWG